MQDPQLDRLARNLASASPLTRLAALTELRSQVARQLDVMEGELAEQALHGCATFAQLGQALGLSEDQARRKYRSRAPAFRRRK